MTPFETYGKTLPAEGIGGDFYDFFPLDPDRFAFTIADASGKDTKASILMAKTRQLIREFAKSCSPMDCLKKLNALIENDASMFITIFYGIFHPKTGVIEYCNAGHNPPYVVSSDGSLIQIGREEGIALGVTKDQTHFIQKKIVLEQKSTLLLYTDGVTEAMNSKGEQFQEARLEQILRRGSSLSLKDLVETILGELRQFSGETGQSDDITVFGIRRG